MELMVGRLRYSAELGVDIRQELSEGDLGHEIIFSGRCKVAFLPGVKDQFWIRKAQEWFKLNMAS